MSQRSDEEAHALRRWEEAHKAEGAALRIYRQARSAQRLAAQNMREFTEEMESRRTAMTAEFISAGVTGLFHATHEGVTAILSTRRHEPVVKLDADYRKTELDLAEALNVEFTLNPHDAIELGLELIRLGNQARTLPFRRTGT